jgi:hypothetical protein
MPRRGRNSSAASPCCIRTGSTSAFLLEVSGPCATSYSTMGSRAGSCWYRLADPEPKPAGPGSYETFPNRARRTL